MEARCCRTPPATRRRSLAAFLVLASLSAGSLGGCASTEEPSHVRVVVLRGTPYERGFQHGRLLAGRIRSLYSTLLTNSLMPYLNRERSDVASVLARYAIAAEGGTDSYFQKWQDACRVACTIECNEKCGFSYLLMKESAENLKRSIPQEYLDEMQGVADGADLPFEKVLVLNTFFDTLLSFRAITFYIRQSQAPMLVGVHFPAAADDGADNDGDGQTDEPDEASIAPFEPSPHATLAEVPAATKVVFDLHDIKLGIGVDKGDLPGVNPDTVRLRYNEIQYEYPRDRGFLDVRAVEGDPQSLTVEFSPPGGFREASVESLVLQAGDFNQIVNPPPLHARFMRDERVVFSTKGYGAKRNEIPNEGTPDPSTQPPSLGFAARGTATGGEPLLAHHFALLDSNTTHKHTIVFVHVPDDGIPHVVLGYSGIVWGFSGMNADGLVWSFDPSDSLDNPMVKAFMNDLFDARLLSDGVPIGIVGRDLLARQRTVAEAVDVARRVKATFGWNLLLQDASGDMAALEVDSNIRGSADAGAYILRPDPSDEANLDAFGRPVASAGPDDLRMASHFAKNLSDLRSQVLVFDLKPQRFWTSFYYRSVRAHAILGERIRQRYGHLDEDAAIGILRTPDLVDARDSMMAAVYLPASRRLRYAMGQVPATSGEFVPLDLEALWGGEVAP